MTFEEWLRTEDGIDAALMADTDDPERGLRWAWNAALEAAAEISGGEAATDILALRA